MKLVTALGVSAFVLFGAQRPKQLLTTAVQIHRMPRLVAAQSMSVVLRGTVTYVMQEWGGFAFQDRTDALYVSASKISTPVLRPGQVVEVKGHTAPGNFAPLVEAESVRVVRAGMLPKPLQADWKFISSGACDNDYIRIEGVVRSAGPVRPPAWRWPATAMHIDLGGNLVWAYLRDADDVLQRQLPDANVQISGVCVVLSNSRRQFEQNVLLVSNKSEIQITHRAPEDPFSAPLVRVDHLFGFRPTANVQHRVRVLGTVTSIEEGRVFLQDEDTGLLIRTTSGASVNIGDRAEASGFPAAGEYSAVLQDAVIRDSGSGGKALSLDIRASQVMSHSRDNRPFLPDAMLVRIEATVLEMTRSAREQVLVLRDGGTVFTARVRERSGYPNGASHLEQGTRVSATGVCLIQTDDLGVPRSFELLMRSPQDLRVLSRAPWLTRSAALRVVGGLLALVAGAAIWLALLRRRVGTQTKIIRRQVERESMLEKRFRELVDNASDMVYIRNLEGQLLHVNQGAEHLTGYSRQELLELNIVELLAPEQRASARQQLRARPSDGSPEFESAEWRFLRKDGRETTVEVKQRFLTENQEQVRVEAIGRDVTARTQAMAENQERFRTLADNIAQLAWMADESGFIFWYNQRWFDYTEGTLDEARGWGWQRWHHPDYVERVTTRIRHSFETGETWEDTFPLRGGDGQYRWFLGRAMPIRDQAGRVLRWFGTNTDITDRKQMETELERSNQDLKQFAYVASHDLQEPLRNVCIFTQLLARTYNGDSTPERDDYIAIITSGAKRMESLITDLLTYSQVTGSKKPDYERVDLELVFQKTLQNLAASLVASGASVTADALPVVHASELQISQVVQNLIGNSVKYRRPDATLRVHLHAERQKDHWLFFIRDNGMGFDPQYAENVFGIFKRLHGAEIPGTGIGLAICKTIVERHGGRIWAEARRGEGATFYFTIPDGPQVFELSSPGQKADGIH